MNPSNREIIREPVVAGQFYPGDPVRLKENVDELYTGLQPLSKYNDILALISPHAGYAYSGRVAAEGYIQLDPDREYDTIFLIGSSHRVLFDGASIYTQGSFMTPLGLVPVNLELARKLVRDYSCFTERTDAHRQEHCLEVQLPFLQCRLQRPFRILPIVIATQNPSTCCKIASALKPFLNRSNLFIISTDFSHYPSYTDANVVDLLTARAIVANHAEGLLSILRSNEEAAIPGLSTSLCGWTSVLTLLYMTETMPDIACRLIRYKNSGDAAFMKDKSRVVGYCSLSVSKKDVLKNSEFSLQPEDRKNLLHIARETLSGYIAKGCRPSIEEEGLSPSLLAPAGAFVSLYEHGHLRGCIGRFHADESLYKVVQEMAISSATRDSRFAPVIADELADISIEISVLTPLKMIHSIDEIELGRHGIYIKKGKSSGTYLPQVARKTGWSLDEFLGHCSRDKAGLGWDGWKSAELYTYEAIVFREYE